MPHRTAPLLRFCLLCLVVLLPLGAQEIAKLEVEADSLQFEAQANTVTATGNVTLRKGAQSLRADVITYNTVTEQAVARGNVVFTNQDQIWRGEQLTYNFITEKGSFPNFTATSGPFSLKAESLERLSPLQTRLEQVSVTTCPDTVDPDFAITSRRVDVYEDRIFVMRHPVFFLHGIPFFYLPVLTLDPDREPTQIDVVPGYSSRDGFMLLNSYNRYPAEGYRTKTHLDLRSERGVAAGQDFHWYNPEDLSQHTRLRFYGALDDAPYKNDAQETQLRAQGIDIDEERYRTEFFHRQQLSPTETLWAKASYLSDARVVQDFFRDEFRREPVPETRAAYFAYGEGWNANVEAVRQLNPESFNSVDRLPEGTFNIPRRALDNFELLYESETRAGYLERTYSDFDQENGSEGYDSPRLHTAHYLYYPRKFDGWLNVIPRVGGAATYYGNTREVETRVTPVSTVDENNIIRTVFETNQVSIARSGDLRLLPEIGLETSFKAFSMLHSQPTTLGRGLRHVVEPFADYTFIPEPSLKPEEIYEFDAIDELGETHDIAFGLRNKWQTRRAEADGAARVQDLVNLGLSSRLDLRSDADPALDELRVDTELQLVDWAYVRMDLYYDTDESEVNRIDTQLKLVDTDSKSWISLDQRFRVDDNHNLQFSYHLHPRGPVGLKGYTRFELEEDGAEEQELLLTLRTDCLGYGIGGRWTRGERYTDGSTDEDDFEIWLQIWLTAFPRAMLGTANR